MNSKWLADQSISFTDFLSNPMQLLFSLWQTQRPICSFPFQSCIFLLFQCPPSSSSSFPPLLKNTFHWIKRRKKNQISLPTNIPAICNIKSNNSYYIYFTFKTFGLLIKQLILQTIKNFFKFSYESIKLLKIK